MKKLLTRLRRWLKERHDRQAFADFLHRSNGWHCGCWPCRMRRQPWPLSVKDIRTTMMGGVPIETAKVDEGGSHD